MCRPPAFWPAEAARAYLGSSSMGAGPVDGAAAGAGGGGFDAPATAPPVRLAMGDFSFLFFRMPFRGCAVSGAGAYGPEPSAAVPLCQSAAAHGDRVRPLSGVWAAIVMVLFGPADACRKRDLAPSQRYRAYPSGSSTTLARLL